LRRRKLRSIWLAICTAGEFKSFNILSRTSCLLLQVSPPSPHHTMPSNTLLK
jgi:hypothetical protein